MPDIPTIPNDESTLQQICLDYNPYFKGKTKEELFDTLNENFDDEVRKLTNTLKREFGIQSNEEKSKLNSHNDYILLFPLGGHNNDNILDIFSYICHNEKLSINRKKVILSSILNLVNEVNFENISIILLNFIDETTNSIYDLTIGNEKIEISDDDKDTIKDLYIQIGNTFIGKMSKINPDLTDKDTNRIYMNILINIKKFIKRTGYDSKEIQDFTANAYILFYQWEGEISISLLPFAIRHKADEKKIIMNRIRQIIKKKGINMPKFEGGKIIYTDITDEMLEKGLY